MSTINVNIKSEEKSYNIYINNDNLENLQTSIMQSVEGDNYIVVISRRVYKLYSKVLNFPKEKTYILKDGEKEKNIANYYKIITFAQKQGLTRNGSIIAIGGGVVGDIAGFAASTYMRGINYIQVPTTLLACTDSSVGGKTAINTKYGKNLTGTFYQPKAVYINVNFLKTLDPRQYKSGLGEVVKYAFIEKSTGISEELHLMNYISEYYSKILSRDILTLMELIEMCIKLKISVVEKDEKENNLRMILNLGHTYAHALEKISKYKYTHGECVSAGILKSFEISYKLGKIDKEYKFICQDLMNKIGIGKLQQYDKNKILHVMLSDKKALKDSIRYVLPVKYYEVEVFNFSYEELKDIL